MKTAAISAAITGTTILIEYIPATPGRAGTIKIIVIEGSLEFALNAAPRKKMKLKAGEMVAFRTDAEDLPPKFQIDIGRLLKTSLLIDGGMGSLPFLKPMEVERLAQNGRKRGGQILDKSSRRQPRGRIFSRILTGGIVNKARVAINGRPVAPPATPPGTREGTTITTTEAAAVSPSAPAGGVQLPVRPDRNPPGGGP